MLKSLTIAEHSQLFTRIRRCRTVPCTGTWFSSAWRGRVHFGISLLREGDAGLFGLHAARSAADQIAASEPMECGEVVPQNAGQIRTRIVAD